MYQIVEVHWEDHHDEIDEEGRHGWAKPTPIEELKPLIIKTVGYLVGQNDEMVEIARGYISEADAHDPIDCPMRVIRKNIVLMRTL